MSMTTDKKAVERLVADMPETIRVAKCHPFKEPDDLYVCHPRLQHPAAVEYVSADTAEARERAAVQVAYEAMAAHCFRLSDEWEDAGHMDMAEAACACGASIRALSDTDALAEYVERVRSSERQKWEAILKARDAYENGEPCKPPHSGREKTTIAAKAKFTVQVGRDARVYYRAEVEAENLADAMSKMSRHGYDDGSAIWHHDGVDDFDEAETCCIMDASGEEVFAQWTGYDGWTCAEEGPA
jgi:hypothetical protein